MPTLILLCGMVAVSWYAWLAFRTRVSMSAIGSVMVMGAVLLSRAVSLVRDLQRLIGEVTWRVGLVRRAQALVTRRTW